MEFFWACVLLSLCFASWFLTHSFPRKTRVRLPPGPKPYPIVGNLFELGDKPHISLTKLSQRYGPLLSLQLGQVTTVVASSSTIAKEILRTHDQFFCNRTIPDALRDIGDYSLAWLKVSPRWRNLGKICNTQLFATKILDANQADRRAKVQELIACVDDSMVKGVAVNVGEVAFQTSLNLLSRSFFSIDLADTHSSGSSERAIEFKEITRGLMEEAGKPNLGDFFPVLRKIDPQGIRRRFMNYLTRMLDFLGSVIKQRLEMRKAHDYISCNDMLDTLINITEEENEDMKYPQAIEHLFLVLFNAGTVTTSATLEWAMAEVLHNPECLVRAQEELDQVIGKGKPIEESDITRLPYLQAIIKEALRMHPTGPLLLPRKAESDVEIGGYTVPKGAKVLVNAWAIGRDPSIWDKPNSFMPERFMGLDNQMDVMGKSFELIPFGGGKRICPGLQLAMRMLHLMLGSLINCFDWKLEDGVVAETMNMEEKFGLTLQMAQPLIAHPLITFPSQRSESKV